MDWLVHLLTTSKRLSCHIVEYCKRHQEYQFWKEVSQTYIDVCFYESNDFPWNWSHCITLQSSTQRMMLAKSAKQVTVSCRWIFIWLAFPRSDQNGMVRTHPRLFSLSFIYFIFFFIFSYFIYCPKIVLIYCPKYA